MCMGVLPACLYIMLLPGAHRGPKSASDLMEVELHIVVCHQMCAGNLTQVL